MTSLREEREWRVSWIYSIHHCNLMSRPSLTPHIVKSDSGPETEEVTMLRTYKRTRVALAFSLVRNYHGNMLVLISAIGSGIVLLFLLFALGYVRMLGTNAEQRTAIEAAAIAAAKDVSRIVINDPNFGFVSLSDAAPVGRNTRAPAPDNFYMPVHGINTLMGTLRLDFIIADRLGSNTLKDLVRRDLNNLKAAKERLSAEIKDSFHGTEARDLDGNIVDPYSSAESAYRQNVVRMAGSSSYVPGSMKLTLGSLEGGAQTNIPIPSPPSYAHVSPGQERNGFYMAGMDIPYGGEHFVFASISNSIRLVNPRDFRTNLSSLPYDMPSVVRCEADHRITDQSNRTDHVVKSVACAQAASVYDPRPAPGTLSVSFPDGIMPELNMPLDIMTLPSFNSGSPMVLQTPDTGDFPSPGVSLGPTAWDGPGTPNVSTVWTTTLYDWLTRAGTRLNAKAAIDMQNSPFTYVGPGSNGYIYTNLYKVDTNGDIIHETNLLVNGADTPARVDPYPVASHQQLFAIGQDALSSSDKFGYDAYIRDFGYRPGLLRGGIHGGEPLTTSLANVPPTSTTLISGAATSPINIAWDNTRGSGGGCDSGGVGDGAHWKIDLGTGGPPVAGLHVFTVDGHQTTFFVFANAPLSRNDWGLNSPGVPAYYRFASGPGGGAPRPTYLQNGLAGDIRFRKTIPLAKAGLTGKAHGITATRTVPPPAISPLYKPGW